MTGIDVTGVGLLVTVQDLGRTGFLGQGITTGGAVDGFALQCANRLAGNPDSLAGLEIVLAGMQLTLREQATIAFYGASVPIQIDGEVQDMGQPIDVAAGCAIDVGASRTGTYTYMAVRGGIDTPPVLGSRSTVVRESLGGLMGRGLEKGDVLPIGQPPMAHLSHHNVRGRVCAPTRGEPRADRILTLRYVPGFQYEQVDSNCRSNLVTQTYAVTGAANRMAVPLDGARLETGLSRLRSEATCLGSIQVPPDGKPIVLLNDRQTMGGYPQMGVVLPADCALLGQSRPGIKVKFQEVTITEAEQLVWLASHYEETHLSALEKLWGMS